MVGGLAFATRLSKHVTYKLMTDSQQLAHAISDAVNELARLFLSPSTAVSATDVRELDDLLGRLESLLAGFHGWASPEFDLPNAKRAIAGLRALLAEPRTTDEVPREWAQTARECFRYLGGPGLSRALTEVDS
jgi:hypothetical protein